ncbi:S26 family signal peptidase [Campylobacter coli]|nr:S26 family signal peptidase [Campylobacter coli]ECP9387895.1 S26 family signal peptidase [Campylobacter coli]ECR2863538.1 S26 family signal peptidase [Campylobacter coli]ECR2877455.1 S26 family signal peptidase [Campylobacter coli]ECR3042566.1 S26 family signal peptidase [Campylobacter coli]
MNYLPILRQKVMKLNKNQIRTLINKALFVLIAFIVGNIVVLALSQFYGIGVIHTKSIDKDVFIYQKKFQGDLKDSLIYFSLPVQTRYFDKDSNFGKYVRCEEGQTLSVKDLKYYCDNVFLGIVQKTDKDGNKVEQFIFNGVIPKDKFFVMGTHPRSFDSRYWGFVDRKDIKGVSIWAF